MRKAVRDKRFEIDDLPIEHVDGDAELWVGRAAAADHVLKTKDHLLQVQRNLAAMHTSQNHCAAEFQQANRLLQKCRLNGNGIDGACAVEDVIRRATRAIDAVRHTGQPDKLLLPAGLRAVDARKALLCKKIEPVLRAVDKNNVLARRAAVNQPCSDARADDARAQNDGNGLLGDVGAVGDTLSEAFLACNEKNIPVFLMDTSTLPDEGEFVTRIGTVNYDAGYVGGFYAGQYLKNEGKDSVDAVALHSGDEVSTSRRDGILAGVEAAGVTVNMLNEYHSASREESMANFEDAMTSYDKIDLVVATSAQHGMGAYSAAEAAGRDEMLIVAYDGEQEEMDAIDNGTGTYLATVTQDPAGMARTIADEVGEYIFNGATFEKFQSAPAGVYGKDGQLSAADLGIN